MPKRKLTLNISQEVYNAAKAKGVKFSLFVENALRRELEMPEIVRPPLTGGQIKTIERIIEQKLSEAIPKIIAEMIKSKELRDRIEWIVKEHVS